MSDPRKPDKGDEKPVSAHLGKAVELASQVATDARRQWAGYKTQVLGTAGALESAAKRIGAPSEVEKEFMNESAKAASSMADVLIEFADAAFEAMRGQGEDTRRKATDLARKIVKLAVDDTLEGDSRTAPRATRMLELYADGGWQVIYLPRTTKSKAKITLELKGRELGASIEVRVSRGGAPATLSPKKPKVELELLGSRPSLSIRVNPKEVSAPGSGLLLITGAHTLTLSLFALPVPKSDR